MICATSSTAQFLHSRIAVNAKPWPPLKPQRGVLKPKSYRAVHVKGGKAIAIAQTRQAKAKAYPNVPTMAESGFPGFEALNWYAFVAPGKTPAPLLDRWNQEIVKVLNDPGVKDALNKHGLTPQPTTRAELTAFMKKESAQWAATIKERKITAD